MDFFIAVHLPSLANILRSLLGGAQGRWQGQNLFWMPVPLAGFIYRI
jgi:hypothetical protein